MMPVKNDPSLMKLPINPDKGKADVEADAWADDGEADDLLAMQRRANANASKWRQSSK